MTLWIICGLILSDLSNFESNEVQPRDLAGFSSHDEVLSLL